MSEYMTMRRIEQSIVSACQRRGIACGDIYADRTPLGTPNQELLAAEVYLDLPAKLRTPESWQMCRAVVRPMPVEQPARGAVAPAHRHEHPAIARERRSA